MKKKLFAMYALVGALVASPVFTSCIDSEESPSVTAVRTAKAEQLKAAAALSAAQQAIAEANQVHQEKLNAIALEKAEWGLEEAKLDHEKTMLTYEKEILEAQKDLWTAQANLEKYNDGVLSTLTNDYINAVNAVTLVQKNIFNKNANLTALKAGLVEVQDYVAETTEDYNNQIAAKKTVLEMLEAYDIDKVGIVNQLKEMDQKLNTISNDKNAWKLENGTLETTAAETDIKLATILAAKKLATSPYNINITTDVDGYLILSEEDVVTYKQSSAYTNNVENLEALKAALGTDKDTETTVVEEGSTTLTMYAALAKANKDMETAKAMPETTDAEKTDKKDAIEDAELAIAKAKDAINAQLVAIKNYVGNDVFDGYIAAFAGEDYEAYKAAADAWTALDDAEKDVEAEKQAILDTFFSSGTASSSDYTYSDPDNNTPYYYSFKSGYNIDEEIAILEGEIATLEESLENLTQSLNLPNVDGDYSRKDYTEAEIEALIAFVEAEIATLNEQLGLKQALADKAKAALDAYIAEHGGETEEEA